MQIDIKPDMLSLRYPMEVNLVGDSAETLARAAASAANRIPIRHGATSIEGWTADWWKKLEERALADAEGGVNPQRPIWELSSRVPSNAIVTSDSGSGRQLVRARSQGASAA